MQRFTTFLLWLLSFMIFFMLVLSILIITNTVPSWLNILQVIDKISLASPILISCGVLIATLTFFCERRNQAQENERNRAKFYLDLAERGFVEVYELLKDKNNNRIIWVRAARVLLKTRSLKTQVSSQDFHRAFLQLEERVRNELYRKLTIEGENGERKPLPPQFFNGIKDWESEITLDDAAIRASSKIKMSSITIEKVIPEPSLEPLAPRSIVAIYEFLEFPKDYEDPLDEIETWKDDWKGSLRTDQGARRYIAHWQEKYAIDGNLHLRSSNKEG